MTVSNVLRAELGAIEEKLQEAYRKVGYSYIRIGLSSATFKDAVETANTIYARKHSLLSALEIIESEWVVKRVAKAS